MNLNFLKVGVILFAAGTLLACNEEKKQVGGQDEPESTIKLNNYLMAVDGRESVRPFNLSATVPWKVVLTAEQKEWIEVIPESGEGNYKATPIKVKVKENAISKLSREAQITFSLTNQPKVTAVLKITQGTEYFMKIESLALVAFFNATNGPNWTKPWDLSQPIEKWNFKGKGNIENSYNYPNGVYLFKDATGSRRVNRLAWFEPIGMKGKMPEEMKNLTCMAMFELCGFELEGQTFSEFMDVIYAWEDLRNIWFIEGCKFGGAKLPAELANFRKFHHINLSEHDFVGFEDNFGTIDFPILEAITIERGPMTGDLKFEYFDKMPRLGALFLQNNNFTGNLSPKIIMGKPILYLFQVNGNRFTGDFPSSIRNSPLWGMMNESGDAADYFCPQQEGFGFTAGTCKQ